MAMTLIMIMMQDYKESVTLNILVTKGSQARYSVNLIYPGLGGEGGSVKKKNHLPG